MFTPWDLIWMFFSWSNSLQPVVQMYLLASARRRMLRTNRHEAGRDRHHPDPPQETPS